MKCVCTPRGRNRTCANINLFTHNKHLKEIGEGFWVATEWRYGIFHFCECGGPQLRFEKCPQCQTKISKKVLKFIELYRKMRRL